MNNEVTSQTNSGNQESLSLKNNDTIGEKKSNEAQNTQNEPNKIEVIRRNRNKFNKYYKMIKKKKIKMRN